MNSPGGAPTQSALVADRIRELAADKDVPVLAFCEDVAASGGYWLACAADEIYAHATSLVGSIGVVSAGFGLNGLLERFGVERRVHTAGTNKVRLDPFRPEKPEDVEWLESLQGKLHDQFVEWVRERRGGKLDASDEDLFTGEVWTGDQAQRPRAVDGLGTLREVVGKRFPDADIAIAEPRRPLLARLGIGGRGRPARRVARRPGAARWSTRWSSAPPGPVSDCDHRWSTSPGRVATEVDHELTMDTARGAGQDARHSEYSTRHHRSRRPGRRRRGARADRLVDLLEAQPARAAGPAGRRRRGGAARAGGQRRAAGRAQAGRPAVVDAVFADITMPGLSGMEMARVLNGVLARRPRWCSSPARR